MQCHSTDGCLLGTAYFWLNPATVDSTGWSNLNSCECRIWVYNSSLPPYPPRSASCLPSSGWPSPSPATAVIAKHGLVASHLPPASQAATDCSLLEPTVLEETHGHLPLSSNSFLFPANAHTSCQQQQRFGFEDKLSDWRVQSLLKIAVPHLFFQGRSWWAGWIGRAAWSWPAGHQLDHTYYFLQLQQAAGGSRAVQCYPFNQGLVMLCSHL